MLCSRRVLEKDQIYLCTRLKPHEKLINGDLIIIKHSNNYYLRKVIDEFNGDIKYRALSENINNLYIKKIYISYVIRFKLQDGKIYN